MSGSNWDQLATKGDINRILEALHKLHSTIKANRKSFAWELKEWKK